MLLLLTMPSSNQSCAEKNSVHLLRHHSYAIQQNAIHTLYVAMQESKFNKFRLRLRTMNTHTHTHYMIYISVYVYSFTFRFDLDYSCCICRLIFRCLSFPSFHFSTNRIVFGHCFRKTKALQPVPYSNRATVDWARTSIYLQTDRSWCFEFERWLCDICVIAPRVCMRGVLHGRESFVRDVALHRYLLVSNSSKLSSQWHWHRDIFETMDRDYFSFDCLISMDTRIFAWLMDCKILAKSPHRCSLSPNYLNDCVGIAWQVSSVC